MSTRLKKTFNMAVAALVLSIFGFSSISSASVTDETVVYPTEIFDIVHNPNIGYYFIDNAVDGYIDAGRTGTYPELNQVAVLSDWAALNPAPGVYDWSLLDQAVNYWISQGKKINFRVASDVMLLDEFHNQGAPEWIYQAPYNVPYMFRGDGEFGLTSYKFPDYGNATYVQLLTDFVNVFADRYRSVAETVDIRAYGLWGEWHSGGDFIADSGSPNNLAANRQKKMTDLARIIDIWRNAWGDRVLLVCVSQEYRTDINPNNTNPANYQEYISWSAFDHAFSLPRVGPRRDGTAGNMQQYEKKLIYEFHRDNRRDTPITLEYFGGYPAYSVIGGRVGLNPTTALDESLLWHPNEMTIMGWDSFGAPDYYSQRQDLIDKGNTEMGYRIVLNKAAYQSKIEVGSSFSIKQKWTNRAYGKLYKKFALKVYLTKQDGTTVWSGVDNNFDLTGFVNDHTYNITSNFNIDTSVPDGIYDLRIALVDGAGSPTIKLAIEGIDSLNRYKLGTIQVGSSVEGFESGSFALSDYTAGWQGSYGTITSDATRRITGTYSAYASFNSADNWYEFIHSDLAKVKLEPGATYQVTFKGKTVTDFANGGYGYFSARTSAGGPTQDVGFNSWTDPAGGVYTKTFTFALKDYSDYYLVWGIRNAGAMSIDDINIRKISGADGESFESGVFASTRYMQGTAGGSITTANGQVISGMKSVYGSSPSSTDSWYEYLQTDQGKYTLEPNATYEITFKYKTLADLGPNGHYYFYAYSPTGGHAKDKGLANWFDKPGFDATTRTIIVTLDNYSDYRFIWGIRNGGSIAVDDIQIKKIKNPIYEGFEGGSWSASKYVKPQGIGGNDYSEIFNASGTARQISGNYTSFAISNTLDQWYDCMHSDKSKLQLLPNTTYTVTFRYKIEAMPQLGGYFYFAARTDSDPEASRGFYKWIEDTVGRGDSAKTVTFKTGNYSDYYLTWGISRYGAISIDEITVMPEN